MDRFRDRFTLARQPRCSRDTEVMLPLCTPIRVASGSLLPPRTVVIKLRETNGLCGALRRPDAV